MQGIIVERRSRQIGQLCLWPVMAGVVVITTANWGPKWYLELHHVSVLTGTRYLVVTGIPGIHERFAAPFRQPSKAPFIH